MAREEGEVLTTGTPIDLSVDWIRHIKNPYMAITTRLRAAIALVEEIEVQLSPDERRQLEVEDGLTG